MKERIGYAFWPAWLVARRELETRARSKSMVVTTAIMMGAVIAAGILFSFLNGQTKPATKIALAPSVSQLKAPIEATADAFNKKVTVQALDGDGQAQLKDKSIDVFVSGDPERLTATVRQSLDDPTVNVLHQVAAQAALAKEVTGLGGDMTKVSAAMSEASVKVDQIEKPRSIDGGQVIVGMFGGILLYITLMTCGQLVAQGVVEEKTSRVVELLLSTIRPWQLMTGKVIGLGLIGLAQTVLVAVTGVVTAWATGVFDVTKVSIGTVAVWVIIWYIVGFATYAVLFAGLAALVSRQEDVGSVLAPVMMIMIIPYAIGVGIAPADPTSGLIAGLSMVPFFAPMLMPIEIALGGVTAWEAVLGLLISVVIVPILIWFSGRIYSRAVLRTGARLRIRDVLSES